MLNGLRDRQSALALAILYVIVGLYASISHQFPRATLAEIAAVASDYGSASSYCVPGENADDSVTIHRCDACRLIEAPGVDTAPSSELRVPLCGAALAIGPSSPAVRTAPREQLTLPRAPPVGASPNRAPLTSRTSQLG